jgi:hypothetical protein
VNMCLFVRPSDQYSRHASKPGAEGAVTTLVPDFQPSRIPRVLRRLDPVELVSVRPPR